MGKGSDGNGSPCPSDPGMEQDGRGMNFVSGFSGGQKGKRSENRLLGRGKMGK